jgi:hypothetical protein
MHIALWKILTVPNNHPLGRLTQKGSDWIRSSREPSKGDFEYERFPDFGSPMWSKKMGLLEAEEGSK